MKQNKEPLRNPMDRRLSFLDELPSCRAAVQQRIAQEVPESNRDTGSGPGAGGKIRHYPGDADILRTG